MVILNAKTSPLVLPFLTATKLIIINLLLFLYIISIVLFFYHQHIILISVVYNVVTFLKQGNSDFDELDRHQGSCAEFIGGQVTQYLAIQFRE